ncbi:GlxA family transcriptional regulator [Sphingomonas alpina]|uniref:GlxA family transcriptional regulator n=1 Tax=Sphingomonas alpina TaxID=653931 RepID=A0A7H0LJD8_9SPHN|nr:GlxA family transcriptional regulator [Sphingomonas alpina]QNQ09791.1 GlxA family transcriptional regulator [Sphingomonas alpina]
MAVQTVAVVIHDGVQALDVAGPVDVFAETNAFIALEDRYESLLVAADRDPVRASNGMRLLPDLSFADPLPEAAIVLVAGGPALPDAPSDAVMSDWLRAASERAALYGSICTGAFALGHAGLLDEHRVTTHWQNAQRLAALFPNAQVEHDRIHLRDGRLVTSAGVTAGIDLALSLVSERHGPAIALLVAKRLVVTAQRQGGQSQFSPFLTAPADETSPIARVQVHVMEYIRDRHTLRMLADGVGMSTRTLARLFVQETGITPHEFVERARVDAARNLLEGTGLALKAVAFDCGFGTADRMRAVFVQRLGISPAQYRASFRRE